MLRLAIVCAVLGLVVVGVGCIVFFNRLFHAALPILVQRLPARLTVGRASLRWGAVELENVSLRTTRDKNLVTVDHARVAIHPFTRWWSNPTLALGNIDVEKPAATFEIDSAGHLNWSSLSTPGGGPNGGPGFLDSYRGQIALHGGFVHIQDERSASFLYQLHQVDGTATFAPGESIRLQLSASPLDTGAAQLELKGEVDPANPELNLHLLTHGLGLRELALYPLVQQQAAIDSGSVDIDLHVRGAATSWAELLPHLRAQGQLSVTRLNGRLGRYDVPLTDFSGTVHLVAGELALDHVTGKLLGAPLDVHGRMLLPGNDVASWVDLTAHLPDFDLSTLRRPLKLKDALSGHLRVEAHLEGDPFSPSCTGYLRLQNVRYGKQRLSRASSHFQIDAASVFLPDAVATTDGKDRLNADGWIFRTPKLPMWVRVRGHQPHLGSWIPALNKPSNALARHLSTDFAVTVAGTLAHPLVFGVGTVAGAPSNPLGVEAATAHLMADSGGVLLWDGRTRGGPAIQLPWGFLDLRDHFAAVGVDTQHFPVPPNITLGDELVGGNLSAHMVGWGSIDHLDQLRALARVDDGILTVPDAKPVTHVHGGLWLSGLEVGIPHVVGDFDGGQITVAGTWRPLAKAFDLGFLGKQIPLDELARNPWFEVPLQPHERASVKAVWEGKPTGSTFAYWSTSKGGNVAAIGERIRMEPFGIFAMTDGFRASAIDLNGFALPGRISGQLGTEPFGSKRFRYWADAVLSNIGPKAPPVLIESEGAQLADTLQIDHGVLSWPQPNPTPLVPYLLEGEVSAIHPAEVHQIPATSWLYPSPQPTEGWATISGRTGLKGAPNDLRVSTRNLDVAWLAQQPAVQSKLGLKLTAAYADTDATVTGTWKDPTIRAHFYSPWLALAPQPGSRSAPVFSTAGTVQLDKRALRAEPFWLSALPYDAALRDTLPENLPRSAEERRLKVTGEVTRGGIDLRVATLGFPVDTLRTLLPIGSLGLSGQLVADGFHIFGPLAEMSADGKLSLKNAALWVHDHSFPIDEARLELASSGKAVHISDLRLRSGPLEVVGQGGRDTHGVISAGLTAAALPLDYLHLLGRPFDTLEGNLNVLARYLQAPGHSPSIALVADSDNLAWKDPTAGNITETPISFSSLHFGQAHKPVRLTLEKGKLVLDIPDGSAEARLAKGGDFRLAGQIVAHQAPSGNLLSWLVSPLGPDFGSSREPFHAWFSGIPWGLIRDSLGLGVDERTGSLGGRVDVAGNWAALGSHGAHKGQLPPTAKLEVDEMSMQGPGADGTSGVKLDGHALVTLAEGKARDGGLWLSLAPATLEFFHQEPLHPLKSPPIGFIPYPTDTNSGTLTAEAQLRVAVSPGHEGIADGQNLKVTLHELGLSTLGFLFPTLMPLNGTIHQLELTSTGGLPETSAKLAMDVGPSTLGTLNLAGLRGSVEMAPDERGQLRLGFHGPKNKEELEIYFGHQISASQLLKLQGQMGLQLVKNPIARTGLTPVWGMWTLGKGSDLGLSADFKDQSMSLAQAFMPAGSHATGNLYGHLDLGGTLEHPQVSGKIEMDDATIQVPKLTTPITNFNMQARFERISREQATPSPIDAQLGNELRSRYSIDKLQGMLGLSPFSGKGKAELSGLRPTFLDVMLKGEHLPIGIQGLFSGRADVDLALKSKLGQLPGQSAPTVVPELVGNLTVSSGELHPPLSAGDGGGLPGVPSGPLPFLYNLGLKLGDDVWVTALGSRVRTEGSLALAPSNTTGLPVLDGQLFLSRGLIHIPLYELSFIVRQGYAKFEHSLMPRLQDVTADTTFGAYQITAHIDGTYPNIHADLISNPPLPNADLQRMTSLTGNSGPSGNSLQTVPTSQLDQQQTGLGSQGMLALTNLLSGPLTQGLGKLFLLSEVGFDVLPGSNDYAVRVAKALDDKDTLLITLLQAVHTNHLYQSESQYGLEWRFKPNFLMRVTAGSAGTYNFWFQGISRFL